MSEFGNILPCVPPMFSYFKNGLSSIFSFEPETWKLTAPPNPGTLCIPFSFLYVSVLCLSSSSFSNEAPEFLNEFEVTDDLDLPLYLPLKEFLSWTGRRS